MLIAERLGERRWILYPLEGWLSKEATVDKSNIGILIVVLGIGIVMIGILKSSGLFSWFGNLPGDFRFEGSRWRLYAPVASLLLVSVFLSGVYMFARRFF